ncbi:MAG: hypothetical protein MJ150_03745 [Clostridia bacterium]|nr:hypothetical protein [Clostridia bacterium]
MSHKKTKVREVYRKVPILRRIEHLSVFMAVVSIGMVLSGLALAAMSANEIFVLIHEGEGHGPEVAACIKELAEGLVMIIHYTLVTKFLIDSLHEGVPFTHEGAKEIRIIGWETILLPLLVQVIGIIAHIGIADPREVFGVEAFEIMMGVILLQTGYVIEYGTERIERAHRGHEAIRYIKKKYPDIIEEAKQALIEEGFDEHDVYDGIHWYDKDEG